MKQSPPSPTALRVADLSTSAATAFEIRPDPERLGTLAGELGLLGLRKLSFAGTITAEGQADWRLDGRLGATVVQPCGVTLEPVSTRIDADVTRLYQRDFAVAEAPETEMPEDDTAEPLGRWIDPGEVMTEALILNLPLYPRAPGADPVRVAVSEPGVVPMTDEDARPFAGLADLKRRLEGGGDDPED